mgnify:CR=1 FL=1
MGIKISFDINDIFERDNVKQTLSAFLPESILSQINSALDGLEFRIAKPISKEDKQYKIVIENKEIATDTGTKMQLSIDIPPEILGIPKVKSFMDTTKDKFVKMFLDKFNS